MSEGKPIRGLSYDDPTSAQILRELQLLTSKRVLYVANVGEDDLAGTRPDGRKGPAAGRRRRQRGRAGQRAARSGDRRARRGRPRRDAATASASKSRRSRRSPAPRIGCWGCKAIYTAGPKEIRAWTIPVGATAPQAAGVIHTDFERGFIRVEVYSVDDLVQYGSEKAIREAGKMRLEGKIVRDAGQRRLPFPVQCVDAMQFAATRNCGAHSPRTIARYCVL